MDRLEERLRKIEERLVKLEDKGSKNVIPFPVSQVKRPVKEKGDWEITLGRVWLPWIFIFVLLLGVLWGFSAAVSSGYITQPLRVLIGFIVSGLMIYLGEKQFKNNRPSLGSVLLGGSVAMVMLSTFALTYLYELVPSFVGFLFGLLWIVAGLFLGDRHKSQTLLIISNLAGFLIPFLVYGTHMNTLVLESYETLFSLGLLGYSILRKFTVLTYVSMVLMHLTLLISASRESFSENISLSLLAIGHHIIFVTFVLRMNAKTRNHIALLFTSFVATTIWSHLFLYEISYRMVLVLAVLIYGALCFYYRERKQDMIGVFSSMVTFAAALLIFSLLSKEAWVSAFLVEGTLSIVLGLSLKSKLQLWFGYFVYGVASYFTFTGVIETIFSTEMLSWTLWLVSSVYLYSCVSSQLKSFSTDTLRMLRWVIGIALLIYVSEITGALTQPFSTDVRHICLSLVWLICSVSCAYYGFVRNNKAAKLAGIILLFITLLKLVFVDFPDVTLVVRSLLFTGVGAIGVALSRFFYRKK